MFMSFFVHRNSDMLPIGQRYRFDDLRSHPAVASRYEWVEVEWTGEDEVSLEVRDERRDVLKAILLADFPTRAEALAYAVQHLPDGLTTLDLGGATLPAGIKFPDGLTTLHLGGATVPAGIKFPAGLTELYLNNATLPAGIVFPDGLTRLDLSGVTLPEGTKFPTGLKGLDLGYATLPAGIVFPDGLTWLNLNDATLVIPSRTKVFGAPWCHSRSCRPAARQR